MLFVLPQSGSEAPPDHLPQSHCDIARVSQVDEMSTQRCEVAHRTAADEDVAQFQMTRRRNSII